MIFRKWEIKDNDRIAQLELECFKSPWSKNMLDQSCSLNNFIGYVAELNNTVVGYAGAIFDDLDAEILNIAVSNDFRRQGVAEKLLRLLLEEFNNCKKEKVFLEVRTSNYGAQALYKKLGFNMIGLRKKYYENTEDAIIMAKCFEV